MEQKQKTKAKKPADPKRVKAGRKSRRKGKKRENEIAKSLSHWWTGGSDNKVLRRAPLSGGFPKKGADGDILPMKPAAHGFPFIIDVKDRKSVESMDFADLLSNKECPIFKWFVEVGNIVQNNPEAHARKLRLLIIHKNRRDYGVIGAKELAYIEDNAGPLPYIKVRHRFMWETLYVFPLPALFDKDPETLRLDKVMVNA